MTPAGGRPGRVRRSGTAMQKNVYKFIYKFSRRDQLLILFFTILSFPFMYYSLELPKLIVNEAIGGAVDFPVEVLGLTLDQITYLFERQPQHLHRKIHHAAD